MIACPAEPPLLCVRDRVPQEEGRAQRCRIGRILSLGLMLVPRSLSGLSHLVPPVLLGRLICRLGHFVWPASRALDTSAIGML